MNQLFNLGTISRDFAEKRHFLSTRQTQRTLAFLTNDAKHTKSYYYLDEQLQVREVRWPRLKVAGVALLAVVACLAAVLGATYGYFNLLGPGNGGAGNLAAENRELKSQLQALTSRMGGLESSLGMLDQQGNQLRLMVDLPALDTSARIAGTGGAADVEPVLPAVASDDARQSLQSANAALRKLIGEVRVEEQSYSQILEKYNSNKAYFAALPALKPMEGYYSANDFGLRMHPVLGVLKTHTGLDIVNDVGTPVYAAADGVVELAGHSGGGYGIVVVLKHAFGYQTLYGHLSKILVREGAAVKRGALIAKSGRTGLVSGPHLHYEVRLNGVCRNPIDYFFDDTAAADYRVQIARR